MGQGKSVNERSFSEVTCLFSHTLRMIYRRGWDKLGGVGACSYNSIVIILEIPYCFSSIGHFNTGNQRLLPALVKHGIA